MRMTPIAPPLELTPFVKSFTFVEMDAASTSALLPDTGFALGLRYRGEARNEVGRLPDAALSGLRTTTRHLETSAGGGIIVTRFTGTGAARFFAQPLHELFGQTVGLADVVGSRSSREVSEQVAEARDDAGRIAAVSGFLRSRLSSERADPLMERAAEVLHSSGGLVRISELAVQLGLKLDALEKRFRAAIGATPKQVATVVRLQRAIYSYRGGANLTQAAFDAGYSDQSHFIRAFRAATGEAPRTFFRRES